MDRLFSEDGEPYRGAPAKTTGPRRGGGEHRSGGAPPRRGGERPRRIGGTSVPAYVSHAAAVVSTDPALLVHAEVANVHAGSGELQVRRGPHTPRRWRARNRRCRIGP